MAMKVGPRTFQWACLTWACRSIVAARCRLSTAADFARMFLDRVLAVFCMNALLSRQLWLRSLRSASALDAEGPSDSGSIGRVGLGTIGDVPLLDMQARVAHRAGRVLEQGLLLGGCHQAEKIARLLPVVIIDPMVPVRAVAVHRHRKLGEIRLIVPEAGAVGIEGNRAAESAVGAHLAVAMIAAKRAFRGIDLDVVEVDAEPVTLRVAIGEETPLQHLVGGEADAGNDVGGREGWLLDFGEGG